MTTISETAPSARPSNHAPIHIGTFDPALWLSALTHIGGGYVLMADRRLAFIVAGCDADELSAVMAQIIGHADRQDAIKDAIERAQVGEAHHA